MLRKLSKLERAIAAEKGPFSLFGLFLREESPGRWDLVAAAEWFGADRRAARGYLSDRVSEVFNREELVLLSRVVALSADSPFFAAVTGAVSVEHGPRELNNVEFGGLAFDRAYVLTSRVPDRSRTNGR